MIRRTALRSVQAFSVITVLAVLILASSVSAKAATVVERFSVTHTETFTGPLEFCLPEDRVGSVTITESSTGQVVDTGKNVFAVHGVDTFDYHVSFPDGSYVQSGLNRDLFAFEANAEHTVFTRVTQDLRTIYAADGTPVGKLSVHAVFHITDNGGVITSQVEQFHLRCS